MKYYQSVPAAVLVLYHPETAQLQMNTPPLKIHGSDYYMFTSYVMPEAQSVMDQMRLVITL